MALAANIGSVSGGFILPKLSAMLGCRPCGSELLVGNTHINGPMERFAVPSAKRKTAVSSYSRFLNVHRDCEEFWYTWQVLLRVRGGRNVARLVSGRVRFCTQVELQALCRRDALRAVMSKDSHSQAKMTSSQGTWRTDRRPTGLDRFCTGIKLRAPQ